MAGIAAAILAAVIALPLASAVAEVGSVAVEPAEKDRYIVVFRDSVANPRAAAAALGRRHGFTVRHTYRATIKGFSASLPAAAVTALARDPRVAYIEADQPAHTLAQTIPTGIGRIFAPGNPNLDIDGIDDARVDVDVAVIDTGVAAHPDINLAGKTDCTGNPFNTACDDNSGDDGNGHGTHVAGSIAGIDNGIGVVGVAPGARIWAVKVLKDSGSGWISNIIAGVDWVTAEGKPVANMSLGGGSSDALCDAVEASIDAGVTHVVAAGNESSNASTSSPANCNGAITVSALADFDGLPGALASPTCRSDEDDTLANFSNWGSVDIAAPGVCILSTWNDGGYNTISGTSMASPHVAGAAALLASVGGETPASIKATLTGNGNFNWIDDNENDGVEEPLLDVSDTNVFDPVMTAGEGGGVLIDASPSVSITSPADGANFGSGANITFSGEASDDEDGDLSDQIVWKDNGAVIFTGASFDAVLADGAHTVTAEVTDSATQTADTSVSITVGDPPAAPTLQVGSIVMEKKGPHLNTTVTIVDDNGTPAAGVIIDAVELVRSKDNGATYDCEADNCWLTSTVIETDNNGQAKYKLLHAPSGWYEFSVIELGGVVLDTNDPANNEVFHLQ